MDSRPSDAIALGVADGVPMLVDEDVLSEAAAEALIEPAPPVEADDDDEHAEDEGDS